MKNLLSFLNSGDLRSIARVNELIGMVKTQTDFDALFAFLFSEERLIVMRAADAIEKITVKKPEFLKQHKQQVIDLCNDVQHIELKWHLALLLPRLPLTKQEAKRVWEVLKEWVLDKNDSRIVRVNALQGLGEILPACPEKQPEFIQIIESLKMENIPSLNARIRKLEKQM